jgi:hypothetical protein
MIVWYVVMAWCFAVMVAAAIETETVFVTPGHSEPGYERPAHWFESNRDGFTDSGDM